MTQKKIRLGATSTATCTTVGRLALAGRQMSTLAFMVSYRAEHHLLRPRPATWGGGTPASGCTSGSHYSLADGSPVRVRHAGAHSAGGACGGRIAGTFPGSPIWPESCVGEQAVQTAGVLLHFDETPAAEEAQIQACDEQHITIPGDDSQAALHIPVHMSQGQLISPFLCQLTVHGLPPSLARQGIGHQLLSRAGYTSQECTVEGEFMGDLPTQYASQQAAAGVGNADACLIFIRPPPGDRELLRMPKSFRIGEERIHISRPGQRLPTHTQPLTADSQVVTHREGPRTIRTPPASSSVQLGRAAAAEPKQPHRQPGHRMQPGSGAAIAQSTDAAAGSRQTRPPAQSQSGSRGCSSRSSGSR